MRFRDLRMTRIKSAIYPEGAEPPTLSPEELRGLPEPTPRYLSQYIGHTANRRRMALALDFPTTTETRSAQRRNNPRPRSRPAPVTEIDLPWRPRASTDPSAD